MNEKKIYRHYGSEHFDPEKFNPIHGNMLPVKPNGGFWASPLINGKTPWECWSIRECFHIEALRSWFDFTLYDNANVLHIWNEEDVESLPCLNMADWMETSESLKQEDERMGLLLGCRIFGTFINFEHLVEEGVQAIELHYGDGTDPEEYDDDLYYALYGWDCSSILIMDPSIITEISTETINKIQDGEISA